MNKLQESLIREFIKENLHLEEKSNINEGQAALNVLALIGFGLGSFLNTSIGRAITTQETKDILKTYDLDVETQVAGANRVFFITDKYGNEFTTEIKSKDLLRINKKDFVEEIEKVKEEGYEVAGELTNIFDDLSKVAKNKKSKEIKDKEGTLEKIREKIVEFSKTKSGRRRIRSFYQKNVRGQKRKGQIDMESMAFSVTARRLENEDGVYLGEYQLGRLLYVHILFNKKIKNNFIEKFKLSQQ